MFDKNKKHYADVLIETLALSVAADGKVDESEFKTALAIFTMDDYVTDADSAFKSFSDKAKFYQSSPNLEAIFSLVAHKVEKKIHKINDEHMCKRLISQLNHNWKSKNQTLISIKEKIISSISSHISDINSYSRENNRVKKENISVKEPVYSKRTCKACGVRVPANQLVTKSVRVNLARSRSGVGVMTFVGSFLGDKASTSAIKRTIFNSSQRNYSRTKDIQVCTSCAGKSSASGCLKYIFYIFLIFVFMSLLSM